MTRPDRDGETAATAKRPRRRNGRDGESGRSVETGRGETPELLDASADGGR